MTLISGAQKAFSRWPAIRAWTNGARRRSLMHFVLT
jgi:hypothetical protein